MKDGFCAKNQDGWMSLFAGEADLMRMCMQVVRHRSSGLEGRKAGQENPFFLYREITCLRLVFMRAGQAYR